MDVIADHNFATGAMNELSLARTIRRGTMSGRAASLETGYSVAGDQVEDGQKMRRWFTIGLTTLISGVVGCLGTTSTSTSTSRSGSAVLAELESLPVGLEVIHSPNPVSSPVGPDPKGWPYRWIFRTEVRAIDRPLTIIQFGICAWDGEQWILPSNTGRYNAGLLDQRTFMQWYACPSARIEPGKPAVDPENWAGSHARHSFRQRWFFVGRDDQGKRYKGEAVVELLDSD
jgi:hypothetical protein